jgi:hypothetical protein
MTHRSLGGQWSGSGKERTPARNSNVVLHPVPPRQILETQGSHKENCSTVGDGTRVHTHSTSGRCLTQPLPSSLLQETHGNLSFPSSPQKRQGLSRTPWPPHPRESQVIYQGKLCTATGLRVGDRQEAAMGFFFSVSLSAQ